MEKTKKEIILENARRDPFLKIDSLARRADTTPRYVRTILSEANVSLMELRRNYARSMEKGDLQIKDRLLAGYLLNVPFGDSVHITASNNLLFNNPDDFNKLSGNVQQDYINRSFLHKLNRDTWCINTIILQHKFFGDQQIRQKSTLSALLEKILPLPGAEFPEISDINLKIEHSTRQISDLLGITLLTPLFRVEQSVKVDDEIVVFMLCYFNPRTVNISLSIRRGIMIERKSITD